MESDDYFDDELDSAVLNAFDTIEAANTAGPSSRPQPPAHNPSNAPVQRTLPEAIDTSDSDLFDAFDFDVAELDNLQEQGVVAHSVAGASTGPRASSKATVQTTLFGERLRENPSKGFSKANSRGSLQRSRSSFKDQSEEGAKATKKWDHTAFAKSGWKLSAAQKKAKAKAKAKGTYHDASSEEVDEEPVEFEQFPAPFVPPQPMKLRPDLLATKRWIYPLNHPKRDYQLNIVRQCLFKNTLVALPTGLGKTFIAGSVMLNFYRWFPEGKVIFLAPSKPLVAQQIEACHKLCGVPGSHAAEITGNVIKVKRPRLWEEKRVFYMTPQTLMGELISKACDPRDIVLIVIDEAHKGTGDYAYAQIIRYMMAKNPHFRVLALTATPGSTREQVQDIVDCLHISHIEIRNEESLDIRGYVHKKRMEMHVVKMSDAIVRVRDLLAKIMQPLLKTVQSHGLAPGSPDPVRLHPFTVQSALKLLMARRGPAFLYGPLMKLGPLARAMSALMEGSIGMCYTILNEIVEDAKTKSKKGSGALKADAGFQSVMKEMEAQKVHGFELHPKLEMLRNLLVQHFAQDVFDHEDQAARDGASDPNAGGAGKSRVMVFTSFRENVDEIVKTLNRENPLIKATPFIGQASDKHGNKGLSQKEQLQVIKRFKAGEFNVLVATSIGEEGLDIGEVNVCVCYEAQKTPIRMLQRIGRTGRKDDGVVHVFLAEGREERNWDTAQDRYKDVQNFIGDARDLVLYDDVERLLPDHIQPTCLEMMMDIEEYVREDLSSRKGSRAGGDNSPVPKGKKRKRDDDPMRNIPPGTAAGFVNVKDLIQKASGATSRKSAKKITMKDIEEAGEDDDVDREIEEGVFGARRSVSTSAISKKSRAKSLKRTKTTATGNDDGNRSQSKRRRKPESVIEPTASLFDRMGADDSDDEEIERGLGIFENSNPSFRSARSLLLCERRSTSEERSASHSPPAPSDDNIIDLTTPDSRPRARTPVLSPPFSPDSPLKRSNPSPGRPLQRISTLRRDMKQRSKTPDGSVLSISSSPSLPLKSRSTSTVSRSKTLVGSASPPEPSLSGSPRSTSGSRPGDDMSWLIDDDDDLDIPVAESSSPPSPHSLPSKRLRTEESACSPEVELCSAGPSKRSKNSSPQDSSGAGGLESDDDDADNMMGPPPLPSRFFAGLSSPSIELPEPTLAVRAPGKQKKRMVAIDSSPLAMPSPSQRHLQNRESSSPPPIRRPPKRKFKNLAEARKANPWLDVEATHSGDERSIGSSDVDAGADEYEKDFVRDEPETQASPSYDQSAVYRRSLLTQAPGGGGPVFAGRPARRGWGLPGTGEGSRPQPALSSSPRDDPDDDEYEFGSFIVRDDAEISYADELSSET
ncbi:nucleoside triphosphate hydrolase protein [Wolfiporia cocos MD-104 SS10]|uniref:ATP-dependent DNA helicase n=1 Tax=Wolfiporia cocos (strain MD-104) TaxID=742152 RepID=A0A2H3J728_WOLCO|nr:nucleoside triphosphate hydrolase protein [Wolfiporia cocos MD-104 SS10]